MCVCTPVHSVLYSVHIFISHASSINFYVQICVYVTSILIRRNTSKYDFLFIRYKIIYFYDMIAHDDTHKHRHKCSAINNQFFFISIFFSCCCEQPTDTRVYAYNVVSSVLYACTVPCVLISRCTLKITGAKNFNRNIKV